VSRRFVALTVLFGAAVAAVACGDLFDTAVQCTTDRDCEKYGAVCDVANGVCASRADVGRDAGVTPPPGDADPGDAPPPPPECNIPNKPVVDVPTSPVDAGDVAIATSTTLDCTKDWRLTGRVFVRSGVTLTIQAGTTVRVAAAGGLVIEQGAKIQAAGQRNAPVVFTSDAATPAPGDWLGVYVLGSAPPAGGKVDGDALLPYGGATAADSSGTLRFMRIEYGRYGLLLAGVGNGTTVDYVEARKLTDNAFTFLGGNVDAKYLVTQFPGDEAFEIDGNYTGRLQFLFSQQMPKGSGGHHGFLADNSTPVVYNATFCNDSQTDVDYALLIRNGSHLDMNDAILTGWFGGVDLVGAAAAAPRELRSSIAFGNAGNPAYVEDPAVTDTNSPLFDDDTGFDEIAWFSDAARKNVTTDPALVACSDPSTPQPWPTTAITNNARTPPADDFFDTSATYIGAFKDGTDTWMTGAWVRFSPQ
jgi:hypothetical protein